MDRPWEAFDRARRVLRGRDDLAGWKSADLPSVRRPHTPDGGHEAVKVTVQILCLFSAGGGASDAFTLLIGSGESATFTTLVLS